MAGYSGTPLAKKLGIRPDYKLYFKNPPANYLSLLGPLPEGLSIAKRLTSELDLIHFFTRSRSELKKELEAQTRKIRQNGMIWVSWPKKSSGVESDVSEDVVREIALPLGLVDIKVCAVDETWSALKLVIRRENRK